MTATDGSKTFVLLVSVMAVTFCTSCGLVPRDHRSTVVSTVQVFHRMPATRSLTYVFFVQEEQQQSLEYKTYQDLFRENLSRYGWREAGEGERADAVIGFQYYIDDGKTRSFSVPVWGQTGIASERTTGSRTFGGGYSSTTTYTPSYGVTGYRQVRQTLFTRRLDVVIFEDKGVDAKKPLPLFEGTVASRGQTGILSVVMPYMVQALFEDFPGVNGSVRRVAYAVR